MKNLVFWISILFTTLLLAQDTSTFKVTTVAFYNLENLFDTENDPLTFDDDRTPEGKDHWTEAQYIDKLVKLSQVLSDIGRDETKKAPSIIGVCEAENRKVLEDLVNQKALLKANYGIIQFDSPDQRGIDVALLYQKSVFIPTHYKAVPLLIYDEIDVSKRVFTRDQLVVSGMLDGDKISIIVNHWPSRWRGEEKSRYKRIRAAALNKRIIDSLFSEDPYAKIITMGDFNDNPTDASIKDVLKTHKKRRRTGFKQLYNPMEKMYQKGIGTLAHRDSWSLFDQIIVSHELVKKDYTSYRFFKAGIYNKSYLINSGGKYKGYPFRSYVNGSYSGGYSDHLPVFLYLIKESS